VADGREEGGGNSKGKVLAVEKVVAAFLYQQRLWNEEQSALSWYRNLAQTVARALAAHCVVSGQMLGGNSNGVGRVPGDILGGYPVEGTGMARMVELLVAQCEGFELAVEGISLEGFELGDSIDHD